MVTGAKLSGDKELIRKLNDFGKTKANAINRKAVNAATNPILKAAKNSVPIEHGDLKKAQAKKISNRQGTITGIIGADASYVGSDGAKPSKYDHLVEFGHLSRDGTIVAANPYLQRAWDEAISSARELYETKLAEGIEKELAK